VETYGYTVGFAATPCTWSTGHAKVIEPGAQRRGRGFREFPDQSTVYCGISRSCFVNETKGIAAMSDDLELAEQVKRLTERVETLEHVRELNTLRHNLPRYINDGRWDRVGELFSDSAFLDYAHLGQAEGRAAIQRYFSGLPQLIEDNSPAAQVLVKQFLHGHEVEILGEQATGVSFFEEKVVFDTESSMVAGKFTDDYVREDGRWLFSRIKLDLFWVIPYTLGWQR
jgi:hypothetical protein